MSEKLRWKVAYLVNRLPRQCWADLVSWALGSRFQRWPWAPAGKMCRSDRDRNGRCYCGKLGDRVEASQTGELTGRTRLRPEQSRGGRVSGPGHVVESVVDEWGDYDGHPEVASGHATVEIVEVSRPQQRQQPVTEEPNGE